MPWINPETEATNLVCVAFYATKPAKHFGGGKDMTYLPGEDVPALLKAKDVTQDEWDTILNELRALQPAYRELDKYSCAFNWCPCCECFTCCCMALRALMAGSHEGTFEAKWEDKLKEKGIILESGDYDSVFEGRLCGCFFFCEIADTVAWYNFKVESTPQQQAMGNV